MTAPDRALAARAAARPVTTENPALPCQQQAQSSWRSQFASPRGLGGRLAGWLMARKNAAMNAACVEWPPLAPVDRVLEIGFGHGRTLEWIAERVPSGVVAGIDSSHEMLRMASRRNRAELQSGRMRLALGSAEALPFQGATSTSCWRPTACSSGTCRARSPRRTEFSGPAARCCWGFACAQRAKGASRRPASARRRWGTLRAARGGGLCARAKRAHANRRARGVGVVRGALREQDFVADLTEGGVVASPRSRRLAGTWNPRPGSCVTVLPAPGEPRASSP